MSTNEMQQRDELSFQTTLYVRDNCLCLHVQRGARALARLFDVGMKPFGITSGQFSLLMSLNRPEPPTLGSVASLLALDRTTLTANLKPLARAGLIEISTDLHDRRARRLRLTPDGLNVLKEATPVWKQIHTDIEKNLTNPEYLRSELNLLSQLA